MPLIRNAIAALKFNGIRKLKFRALLVAGALIISYGFFWSFQEKFEVWNSRVVDYLVRLQPRFKPATASREPDVILVDSIFYVSRTNHAQVIENLSSMKVAAQVIDFVFEDKVDTGEDQVLINVSRDAGKVYLGMAFKSLFAPPAASEAPPPPVSPDGGQSARWPVRIDGNPTALYVGSQPQMTYPEFASVSRGLGFLNLTPDPDGVIRRVPLLVRYGDGFTPSLAFRVVCDYLGVTPQQITVKPGTAIILKLPEQHGRPPSKIVIPTDKHGNLILNFTALAPQAKPYSYSQILQASANVAKMNQLAGELTGKIILLSETVEKPYKLRIADVDGRFPAATVHMAAIQNILTGSFLRPMSGLATVLIETALWVVLFLLSLRFSSVPLSIGTFLVSGSYLIIGVACFFSVGLMFQFPRSLFLTLCTLTLLLIGMGIEKALLFAESERARRIAERELEIGRDIQTGFFPTLLPAVPGWELEVHFQAARFVGGDFYDVFTLGPEKKVGIVVADVCDKGVGAALFMALFRSFIRVLSGQAVSANHLESNGDPAGILRRTIRSINDYISITHEQAGMFATIFFGILSPDTGRLDYINGGHDPAAIVGRSGIRTWLKPTGPAVGLYPDFTHDVRQAVLEPGDTLFVYSDGVIDALDKTGKAFTKERLARLLVEPFPSTEALIERIKTQIDAHIAGADQFDDITITALRRVDRANAPD